MRRWLIALFACHFLLGVVGFGIPNHIVDMPSVSVATPDSTGPQALTLNLGAKGLNDLVHALADELPDLPDSLQRRTASAWSHVMSPAQPPASIARLTEPVLAAPFRPPRTV
jgi:hypothetical protein